MYLKGDALQEAGDTRGAMRAFRKAAEDGDTIGQYVLANLLDECGRPKEAVYWYKRAIRGGDHTGAYNLAVHYGNLGKSRWQVYWLRIARKMGCDYTVEDTFNHAVDLDDRGELEKAITHFRSAAMLGHSGAQLDLGVLLETKIKPPRIREALAWYRKAVRNGNAIAAHNLSLHYRDNDDARHRLQWLRIAAKMGHSEAKSELRQLERTKRRG